MTDSKYKLFVSDIDGTLTTVGSFDAPDSTRELLAYLQENGVIVVLATGRSPRVAAGEFVGDVTPDYLISGNGSRVASSAGELLFESSLSAADMDEIIDFAERTDACMAFSFDDGYYFYHNYDKIRQRVGWNNFCEYSYFDCPARDRHLLSMPHSALAILRQEDEREFRPTNSSLLLLRFADGLYDIVRSGVTKGFAVGLLLERLGLTWEQTAIVGDSFNDLPMLSRAGLAVAMGDAPPEIKAACDFVTAPASERGLDAAIKKIYNL